MNHLYEHFTSYINISRARKNGPVRVYVSFGLERLVQSVAYFSRINGPNENSGGGGGRGGGAGILNILLMLCCVPNPRLLHSNIRCNVSQFRSLTIPFGSTHRLPPSGLPPRVPLPTVPSAALKPVLLIYSHLRHLQAFPVQYV